MPQFRYRALDSTGRETVGSLDAVDANAAVMQLSRQGLRLKMIEESMVSVVSSPPMVQAPVSINSAPVRKMAPTAAGPRFGMRPSRRSTYSDRHFMFAQLAGLLRTGITPSDALYTILSRGSGGKFQSQFTEMAKMTSEGMSLSDAMAHYPAMFTEGIVGAVRAGEQGGYLPDACQTISEQQKQTRTVFYLFFGVMLCMPFFLIGVLAAVAVSFGLNKGIDAVRDGNDGPAVQTGIFDTLQGPIGIGFAVFFVLLIVGYFVGRHHSFRALRHRVGLAMPPFRWRAYNENLAHFSYHLGRLAKSGLSPFASWRLAAQAVPNSKYAQRLESVAANLNENTKLSDLLYRANMFPRETANLVETGELTGDLPHALDQVMEVGRQREKIATAYIGVKAGCWTLLIFIGGPTLLVAIVYLTYLRGVFRIIE